MIGNTKKDTTIKIGILGLIWIFYSASISASIQDTDCGSTVEACLIADLFQNYSTDARPRLNGSEPVELEIGHYYMSLLAINSEDETMDSVSHWHIAWEDDMLLWDPLDYNGTDNIFLTADRVWLPDLHIKNSVTGRYGDSFEKVRVYDNGLVEWDFGGPLTTRCEIDMELFPYDSQTCTLIISTGIYPIDVVSINVVGNEDGVDEFVTNLWKHTFTDRPIVDDNSAIYSYTFKRKPLYYMINIVLPLVLLLVLSFGVFWLPPESGEKVSLGITVLLAASVFQLILSDKTPVSSDETPRLIQLVIAMMIVSTCSILSAVLSIYLSSQSAADRVPKIVRFVAFNVLARILFLRKEVSEEPDFLESQRNATLEMVDAEDRPKSSGKRHQLSNDQLEAIRMDLKALKDIIVEKEKENFVIDEWKCLGKITDRCLFWLCVISFAITLGSIAKSWE